MGKIGKLFKKILGDSQAKLMKSLDPLVEQINTEYSGLSSLTETELKDKTREFRTAEVREQVCPVQDQTPQWRDP